MIRWIVVAGSVVAGAAWAAAPLQAYLKFAVAIGDRVVTVGWDQLPIRYVVNDQGVPGVSGDRLRQAAERALGAWEGVSTASVDFAFVGFTSAAPSREDGLNTLGFEERPDLERVLGSTRLLLDVTTGEIVESDIFLNAAFPWSVAETGEPDRYDVESIIVHEAGHLLGLGHSAIGETELRPSGGRRVVASGSVMFPIAFAAGNIDGRSLRADDRAGLTDVYPVDGARAGSLFGRVTRGGRGIFGAHVVAFHLESGRLVGNFSTSGTGQFAIGGLDAGAHVVRVEPLDDGELESFFLNTSAVDVDFRVTFAERLVVVPVGGAAGPVEIEVLPK